MALELTLDGVFAGYGAVKVLDGINLLVRNGETVVLLGANGNGKSTLMKCIAGLVRPQRGSVILTIDGVRHDLARLLPADIVDLGVAMIPEGRRLFPRSTVLENLMLGAYRPAARRSVDTNLDLAYTIFPVLKERRYQPAGTLSGGQQQMVAIARALMTAPKLLLVDEPSVGLSPLLVSQTITKIGEIKNTLGLTILMAEQNFKQATRIANRGYVIVQGRLALDAPSVTALENSDLVKKLYLGATP